MDALEALYTRRSIRKYTDEPISDEDLESILKAAMLAPSARNERPWHFVVIRDRSRCDMMSKGAPYWGMAATAQALVIVCGDTTQGKGDAFWVQDCAAALENLLVAARAKNIGTVWCGVHPIADREAFVSKALNLPPHIVPLGLVCLGHPAQKFEEADRFDPARIHLESW